MSNDAAVVPSRNPPPWLNAMMTVMLRTPLFEHMIGRGVALITVTGRKTGTKYTIPVSYHREDSTVLVITKRLRTWWRNLEANPEVDLRLAGRQHRGHARIVEEQSEALPLLATFAEHRRFDARAFGITFTPEGRVDQHRARLVLSQLVILKVTLAGDPPAQASGG